ncbi:uncharacterized protein HD556DRAFT_1432737 [Suillus plorans]|uniref:Uncharacterized protein n=1 Tax=Suillus plorans TaxID=116603 RepID=A0A9P7AM15_9AGAM|nr:uncharacterized protein HD556DRAFT_1432737 [Suillus plorans]KAG1792002.1 hypothetical protein HD556DRAFT_1432737 [Suillus plorans]
MPPRSPPPNHHVHVEEVEDEERVWMRFIQTYPGQVARTLGQAETLFESIRVEQEALGLDPWAPFADEEEWGLVKWLIARVGQMAIDEFFKLPITGHMNTSFTSKYTLMKAVDQLPRGTEWMLKKITVKGNIVSNSGQWESEELELWLRDPVDCIRELMGNSEFKNMVSYTPERVFADEEGKTCMFDEMWTGEWWWEMQGRLPPGAVVAPVILASDKTSLSQFRGDQEVWPMYLTLRNISKEIRCQPSKRAAILIAYLPISKLECFKRDTCSVEPYHLFHYCMTQVLEPLVSAGTDRVDVTCPDHQVRRLHPIVAVYCLMTCCMENRCPKCVVGCNERGDMMRAKMGNDQFEGELGLQAIYSLFWMTLPHNNIFSCITTDILHQLHKGVFKDHLEELDSRFKEMTLKGISKHKQWTGADYRELQRVFLGVIARAVDNQVLTAVRGMSDFIYYAQYKTHTDKTLARMHSALALFHANKDIFVELGVQEHFNIPKVHAMVHYIDAIRLFWSADGFNTELPERLHIDFTKRAYCASNRRDYIIQMTTWLCQQESIYLQEAYLRWWSSQNTANEDTHSQDSDTSIDSDSDASRGYFVPRTIPFPNSTIQRLIDEHGASAFIPALEEFTHRKFTPQDWVDVYKYLKVLSPPRPHVNNAKCLFKVHAVPVIPSKDARKGPAPAHFNTVLVIEDEDRYTGEGISGLCVGEVKVIFDLPSRFGHFPHPLAYIHWFRPLQTFDDNLQSFKLTRSSWQRGPNAAVLPVNQVLRPCHLVPRFSRDGSEEFYLNRYIDLELFE